MAQSTANEQPTSTRKRPPIQARPPSGQTVDLPANPIDQSIDDACWKIGTADPKSLRLAHRIHRSVHPMATILFGSRAKGTHRPDSDADIILVFRSTQYDETRVDQIGRDIAHEMFSDDPATRALRLQPSPAKNLELHIITISLEQYRKALPYRNTYLTEALLHGVVISRTPDRWATPYADPEPPPNLYDDDLYQHYRQLSLFLINAARTARFPTNTKDDPTFTVATEAIKDAGAERRLRQKKARLLNANLGRAIKYALTSVIYAAGKFHSVKDDADAIFSAALDAAAQQGKPVPDLHFTRQQWLDRDIFTADNIEASWDDALNDVQLVRKTASSINRRNRRQQPL